jgi:hypothetical protein
VMRLNDVSALQAQFVLSSPSGICELTCTQPPTNLAGEFLLPAITLQIVVLWIVEKYAEQRSKTVYYQPLE